MRVVETSKFKKLRKKLKDEEERDELKKAILKVAGDPHAGKKLEGEFRELFSLRYNVKGQSRRLIYKMEKETLVLFSFGPREGIYR
jgi:mRNA-degrading endonuclease RelE of RelBE toxin-antitoxin system